MHAGYSPRKVGFRPSFAYRNLGNAWRESIVDEVACVHFGFAIRTATGIRFAGRVSILVRRPLYAGSIALRPPANFSAVRLQLPTHLAI